MKDYLHILQLQDKKAKAYIVSLVSAQMKIIAEIRKADIAMAREIKRISR